jgi:hypothetical protein
MVGLIQNPVRRDTDMDTPLGGCPVLSGLSGRTSTDNVRVCPVCPASALRRWKDGPPLGAMANRCDMFAYAKQPVSGVLVFG